MDQRLGQSEWVETGVNRLKGVQTGKAGKP